MSQSSSTEVIQTLFSSQLVQSSGNLECDTLMCHVIPPAQPSQMPLHHHYAYVQT